MSVKLQRASVSESWNRRTCISWTLRAYHSRRYGQERKRYYGNRKTVRKIKQFIFTFKSNPVTFHHCHGITFTLIYFIFFYISSLNSSLNPSPSTSFDSTIIVKAFGSTRCAIFLIVYICLLLQAHITTAFSFLE